MIKKILTNRLSYLSISLILFMISLPLVSYGSINDYKLFSLLGVISINIAAAIPPVQRILFPPKPTA